MPNDFNQKEYDLLCVIVNIGIGSKVIKFAKKNGILGATVFLGKGTVKNRILELLDLTEIRKEIVLMIADKTTADKFLEKLYKEFRLDKPNHGIAFSTSIRSILGTKSYKLESERKRGGVESKMYNAIYVIVDKGKAEDVVAAAKKAGARGGTIINARGSGIHEHNKLFSMDIEPEKEFVLILVEESLTDGITSIIRNELSIDEPGNGIIFVQGINKTYGLF
ncbi:MAG: P-II family nitrogen regulator [Clostridiaceae bacterium]|nr:P-II family nitrogen regulator [Clostridiaceae bacterium]